MKSTRRKWRGCGVCCTIVDSGIVPRVSKGDRDCVLGVPAYGLEGQTGSHVPADDKRVEGVVRRWPSMQTAAGQICEETRSNL